MKRVLKNGPGVLSGISVDKPHKGESVLFYDATELILELELNEAYPPQKTKTGLLSGLELEPPIFFTKSIIIEHADYIDVEANFV